MLDPTQQQYPAHAPTIPQPAKRRMSSVAIVGITVGAAVVVLAAVLVGVLVIGRASSASVASDVKVFLCEPSVLKANLTITNSGSTSANYVVTVAFDSPDGGTQYDTATATAIGLAPGQNTSVDALGIGSAPDGAICKVIRVSRT